MLRSFILTLVGAGAIYFLSSNIWNIEDGIAYGQGNPGISGYEHVTAEVTVPAIGPLEFKSVSVDCPKGKRLLGGVFDSNHLRDVGVRATRVMSMGNHDRYIVVFRNMKNKYISQITLKATAICAYAQ
ncbi:MAG: hypothetical protein XU11_C0034G0011 [Candidatus Dadabacteria bacterium CSP1-2]|jgi:hypothetical protein|nr:MAG: hypothetical protein XU11_C0034G0011 [Candidatus Dadabacteria bacterium CSP1-2]